MNHRCRLVFTFVVLLVLFGCSRGVQPLVTTATNQAQAQSVERLSPVAALVTVRGAKVRQQALSTSKVVKLVDQGDLLKLSDEQDGGAWYRIQLGKAGQYAWIHEDAISVLYRKDTERSVVSEERKPSSAKPQTTTAPSGKSYINVDGERVQSPVKSDSKPAGVTARCRDGSYSFSRNRRGTCSHHGGVAEWY